MPAPVAIFFDLDGCLVDSLDAVAASVNGALEAVGLPPRPPAESAWCVGPPLLHSFETLLDQAGRDPGEAPVCIAAYRRCYARVATRLTRVVDGVPALLDALQPLKQMAVVTTKPAHFAVPILDAVGLATFFIAVHAPALDVLDETKTETLSRALAGRVDASRTVMVGDRHHDVEAGRASGTRTIAVTWGAGGRDELQAAGPDAIVDTPAQLATVLLDFS